MHGKTHKLMTSAIHDDINLLIKNLDVCGCMENIKIKEGFKILFFYFIS